MLVFLVLWAMYSISQLLISPLLSRRIALLQIQIRPSSVKILNVNKYPGVTKAAL